MYFFNYEVYRNDVDGICSDFHENIFDFELRTQHPCHTGTCASNLIFFDFRKRVDQAPLKKLKMVTFYASIPAVNDKLYKKPASNRRLCP